MGTTNYGTQTLTFDFRQEATSKGFNRLNKGIHTPGIYNGGNVSISGANQVDITPLLVFILDSSNDVGVRIETEDTIANFTISESTPYIVLRFEWNNIDANYMDIYALSYAQIQSDDIILGKGVYISSTLTSIDTTVRTIGYGKLLEDNSTNCKVIPKTSASFNEVTILPGEYKTGNGIITVTGGNSSTISDTVDNGRIDLVCIDDFGNIYVIEGEEATNPHAPPYLNRFVLAEIRRDSGRNKIEGFEIFNIMPWHKDISTGNDENKVKVISAVNAATPIGKYKEDYDIIDLDFPSVDTVISTACSQGYSLCKPMNVEGFALTYNKDSGNSYLLGGVYDPDTNTFAYGTEVSFDSNDTKDINATAFENGYFAIAYKTDPADDMKITFGKIYESSPGVWDVTHYATAQTVIASSIASKKIFIQYLYNYGNNYYFVIGYSDASDCYVRSGYFDSSGNTITWTSTAQTVSSTATLIGLTKGSKYTDYRFAVLYVASGNTIFRLGDSNGGISWVSTVQTLTDTTVTTHAYGFEYYEDNHFISRVDADMYFYYDENTDSLDIITDERQYGNVNYITEPVFTENENEIITIQSLTNDFRFFISKPSSGKWGIVKYPISIPSLPSTPVADSINSSLIKFTEGFFINLIRDTSTDYPTLVPIKYISCLGITKYQKSSNSNNTLIKNGKFNSDVKLFKNNSILSLDINSQKLSPINYGKDIGFIGIGKNNNQINILSNSVFPSYAGYSIVIASTTSPSWMRQMADIVVNSTDDISDLLNAELSTKGLTVDYYAKRVLLLSGEYTIYKTVYVQDGSILEGMGRSTIIKIGGTNFTSTGGNTIIETSYIDKGYIKNITIDMISSLPTSYNFVFDGLGTQITGFMENVTIINLGSNAGFYRCVRLNNCNVYGNELADSDVIGFYFCNYLNSCYCIGAYDNFYECIIVNNCIAEKPRYIGFYSNHQLSNCYTLGYDSTTTFVHHGYYDCEYMTTCLAEKFTNPTGIGSSGFQDCIIMNSCMSTLNYRGMFGCRRLGQCRSVSNGVNYQGCYADAGTTYPAADTPNGGFNSQT